MILINEIKEIVDALADKQGHATIGPDEFSKYAQMANMDEYQEYTSGIDTYYQLGKGTAKIAPGMNKIIDQKLSVFMKTKVPMVLTSGVFALPQDLEYVDSILAGVKQAKWVSSHMIEKYLENSIDIPVEDYPIYSNVEGGIRIYPDSVTVGKISYLKTPNVVYWGYTVANGRTPVYAATGGNAPTVDFEWGAGHKMSLVTKILSYMGISIRDVELRTLANTEEQKASK